MGTSSMHELSCRSMGMLIAPTFYRWNGLASVRVSHDLEVLERGVRVVLQIARTPGMWLTEVLR